MKQRSPALLLLFLLVMAMAATMAALMLYSAFVPWGTTLLGRRSHGIVIPFAQARWLWGGLGLSLFGLVAWQTVRALLTYAKLPPAKTEQVAGLKLGEAVRWSGRPGLRSLGVGQLLAAGMIILGMAPLAFAIWWVAGMAVTGDAVGALFKLGFALAFLCILGPMAIVPLWIVLMKENRWLHALTGRLLVTDRRLLWCNWRGRVRHAIEGKAIEEVVHVPPTNRNREEVHLRVRTHKAKVEDLVLRGLPDASAAAAALTAISRQSGH